MLYLDYNCKPAINHFPGSVCGVLHILSGFIFGTSLEYFAVVGLFSCLPKLCQFVQAQDAVTTEWSTANSLFCSPSLVSATVCTLASPPERFSFPLKFCLKLILTVLKRLPSRQRVLEGFAE